MIYFYYENTRDVKAFNEIGTDEETSSVITVCAVHSDEATVMAHSIRMLVDDIYKFIYLITRWSLAVPICDKTQEI